MKSLYGPKSNVPEDAFFYAPRPKVVTLFNLDTADGHIGSIPGSVQGMGSVSSQPQQYGQQAAIQKRPDDSGV
jgi:hypothetical protein